MIDQANAWIGRLNESSEVFWRFSAGMFVQVSVLVLVLVALDLLLKRKVRAITRYWLWVLVLLKLMLPIQLGLPISIGYWIAPAAPVALEGHANPIPVAIKHDKGVDTAIATMGAGAGRLPISPSNAAAPVPAASANHAIASTGSPVKLNTSADFARLHWKAYALVAWIGIVIILMGLVARRAVVLNKNVSSSSEATTEIRPIVDACLALLDMKDQQVRVRITERLASPAICGFWKPTVLLPRGLKERLDCDHLRLVIVHELAHWKRWDLQINCLQTFLQVLYFYNPTVWFANSVIRRLREQAVDETVLVTTRSDAQEYGNTLLDVAAAALMPAERTLRLIGVVESRQQLAGRIKRIVGFPIPKSAKLGVAASLAIVTAGLLLLPMAGGSSVAAPQGATTAEKSGRIAVADNDDQIDQPASSTDATAATGPNLRGRLVDETGAPVTDAEIELTCLRNYRSQKTKSDSDGNYKFERVDDAGEYQIEIHSKRWVGFVDREALPRVDLKPHAQEVRDFTLPRACQLQVLVVDERDQPVRGVSIFSSLASDNQNFASQARTDKNGRATLVGLKPSPQDRLVATMGGGNAFTRTIVRLTDPAALIEQKIVLPEGKTVTGKALCSDGKPASGWRINAMPTWWHFGTSPMGQVIAEDGTFSLPHVAPDSYNLIVSIPTGQQMSIAKPVNYDMRLPAGTEPLAVTVDYASPGSMATISGKIEFSGGELQRGMHLFARSTDNKYHGSVFVEQGQQEFEIGPLPRGMYRLEAHSTEIEPLALPVVRIPSDEKLSIAVKVRGVMSLAGVVVRADDGLPVTRYRAQVTKVRTLRGPNFVQDSNWHEIRDAQGAFKFDVHGPGIYIVQVMAEGLGLTASKPFNTDTDGATPIRIEMAAGTPLVGMVVDEQGRPVSGATVFPLPNAAMIQGQAVGQLTPGEPVVETTEGRFTMPQLPPGRGVIKIVHPDFAPTVFDTNARENGAKSAALRIVLQRGATVRGRVYDAEGRPQPNVMLRFQDRSGYSGIDDENLGQLARVTSDADGYYEAQHIPAQYCYVQRDDPWKSWGTVRHAILTANGRTQALDFGGTSKLTGRLIVNDIPLANARVQLSGENPNFGIYKAFAQSDQNGEFTFWGTPPGERTLYFTTSSQADSWVRVTTVEAKRGNTDLGGVECRSTQLTVRVEPAAGAVTDGEHLQLQEFNPKWHFGNPAGRLQERLDRDDPYVFDQVPPGKYELVYYRPNQFAIRQAVEIVPTKREESVIIKVPPATASLSGKLASSICGPDGCQSLNVWSADQRLAGAIVPKGDGTYRLENIPAGDYSIKDKDTRDADSLLTVSLRDGEQKTLDITSDTVTTTTKPVGFAIVEVFTTDGVPIPGCEFKYEQTADAPELSSSQEGRMGFIGTPGSHAVDISYAGFTPLRLNLQLQPIGRDGRFDGSVEQRVHLQQDGS